MIDVRMEVRGNCGKIHKSFQEWRLCPGCDIKNYVNRYGRWVNRYDRWWAEEIKDQPK